MQEGVGRDRGSGCWRRRRNFGIQMGSALGRTTLQLEMEIGNWELGTGCNLCNISCNCHFSSMASFILPLAKCQVPFRPCLALFILLFISHFLNFHSHSHSLSHPSHLLHRKILIIIFNHLAGHVQQCVMDEAPHQRERAGGGFPKGVTRLSTSSTGGYVV